MLRMQETSWLMQGHRVAHLKPLRQLNTKTSAVRAHEHLLLVYAAVSITVNSRNFENHNSWVSKHD